MTRMVRMMQKHGPVLFAAGGVIVVLWQLLLPGYVLTWDMIFGPSHVFPTFSGIVNSAPLTLLIYALGFLAPMWIVQKAILIGLFFSLFYLPIRFFPLDVDEWAKYAAASFYAVNPFVYERFIAGQWGVLLGYALLSPFVYVLLRFLSVPTLRTAAYLALVMLLLGLFSLHAFVMVALIAPVACIVWLAWLLIRRDDRARAFITYAFIAGAIVGIGSLYWILPLALHPQSSPLTNFGEAHWKAFATSIDPTLGASANVAFLYGFWGESYPRMQTLFSPKAVPLVYVPALLALGTVVIIGIVANRRKPRALFLIGIALSSFIFSLGLAPSFAHGINRWLFEHVSLWRGFRDTQKWSMWLALAFAYLYAAGSERLAGFLRPTLKYVARCALILLPLVYTFTLLGGLAGEVRPVEYPQSWHEVNAILAKDPDCKALFLPWHEYYWLAFNHNILTGNTAPGFFDCRIISSHDAEIGDVGDQGKGPQYEAIARAVTDNHPESADATLAEFRKEGIRYMIVTNDLGTLDAFKYPFLTSPRLTTLYTGTVDNLHITLIQL